MRSQTTDEVLTRILQKLARPADKINVAAPTDFSGRRMGSTTLARTSSPTVGTPVISAPVANDSTSEMAIPHGYRLVNSDSYPNGYFAQVLSQVTHTHTRE